MQKCNKQKWELKTHRNEARQGKRVHRKVSRLLRAAFLHTTHSCAVEQLNRGVARENNILDVIFTLIKLLVDMLRPLSCVRTFPIEKY